MRSEPPDFEIRPVGNGGSDQQPRLFKLAKREAADCRGRRRFLKAVIGTAAATVGSVLAGCGGSTFDISADERGQCTCHVQCTCDTDQGDGKHHRSSERSSVFSGTTCTCDTVCTCNMVCTCDAVSSGGGGGGVYCTCDSVCTCNLVYY